MTKNFKYTQNYAISETFDFEITMLKDLMDVSHFKTVDPCIVKVIRRTERTGYLPNEAIAEKTEVMSLAILEKMKANPFAFFENNPKEKAGLSSCILCYKKEDIASLKNGTPSRELDLNGLAVVNDWAEPFQKGEADFFELDYKDGHVHVYTDRYGEKFMKPIRLEYISASIDNRSLLLDEFVDFLNGRDDVFFELADSFNTRDKVVKAPVTDKKQQGRLIKEIPYYNQDEGRTEYACVYYTPSSSEIERLMGWKEEVDADPKLKSAIYSFEMFVAYVMLNGMDFKKEEAEPEQTTTRKFKSR